MAPQAPDSSERARALLRQIGGTHVDEHLAFRSAALKDHTRFPFSIDAVFAMADRICEAQSSRYTDAGAARRVHFAVLDSLEGSAYAVWLDGVNEDWVVCSTALLSKLFANALVVGTYLGSQLDFPEWPEVAVLRDIRAAATSTGVRDSLVSLLFDSSLSFVIGHELGHHAYGHEVVYRGRGSSAASEDSDGWDEVFEESADELEKQALELAADHAGVELLVREVANRASGAVRSLVYPEERLMAVCAASLVCAFASLGARRWTRNDVAAQKHPIAAIRCYAMLVVLYALVPQVSGRDVNEQLRNSWWAGFLMAADVIGGLRLVQTRLEAQDRSTMSFETRVHDTLEVLGLKRVFFDDNLLKPYVQLLHAKWGDLRERCKPAWRYDEPLPLMS